MSGWLDWLEPELPSEAADLSERAKSRLLADARKDVLLRTYTGTFTYPVLAATGSWIIGLTRDHAGGVAVVTTLLAIIVVVRVFLYRRAIADTTRPSRAGRGHLLLGIVSAAGFAIAIGCAYVARDADNAVTAGYVAIAGLAGAVVMIANTHRWLARVWVLASIVPGLVLFVVERSATSQMLLLMYLMYLPILNKMIEKGYASYWTAQVSAARLDAHSQELARVSRVAGMAENATNVLHDVGNALNVVKTSLSCLQQAKQRHPAGDLRRLGELLVTHEHDLAQFLTADPRGARILPFLDALAKSGTAHATESELELARIAAQLEHIEVIVRRQQDIAGCVGNSERCEVSGMVADAIGLSRLGRTQQREAIDVEVDAALAVEVDRHRALQILVNLMDNACDALVGCREAPRVRIAAMLDGGSHVLIEVADNGCGFDDEVSAKLFTRGFTTKPHGHGFGLHGGFSLAQALGGGLSCASDGPGRGARFQLRLPRALASAA